MSRVEMKICHKAMESPIMVFVYFHKAIRGELNGLREEALAIVKGKGRSSIWHDQIQKLRQRYRFLKLVCQHHSNAEDEVIFRALDKRVKNVVLSYTLEHKGENDLFEQVFGLLNLAVENNNNDSLKLCRELVCCTEAIQTSLCQHMSKEEEQVLPLLTQHFSFREQASLVWQFMCSMPVNLMEEFLPWLLSSLSVDEKKHVIERMHKIVPEDKLLQEVVFAWLEDKTPQLDIKDVILCNSKQKMFCLEDSEWVDGDKIPMKPMMHDSNVFIFCKKMCKSSPVTKHDLINNNASNLLKFPIDEILLWHKAIKKEIREISDEAQKMHRTGDLSSVMAFINRLRFLADVCIFHSAAEEEIVFPAIKQKVIRCMSIIIYHAWLRTQLCNFRSLIEIIHFAGGNLNTYEISSRLSAQADLIKEAIEHHFVDEEFEILPLAREHCSIQEQRTLLYESLRIMPLKILEHALPWLVATLSEQEAMEMLQNMHLAAPISDVPLIRLFTEWACKGIIKNGSKSGRFVCISSNFTSDCCSKNQNENVLDKNNKCDVCTGESQSHDCRYASTEADERPLKRSHSCKPDNRSCSSDLYTTMISTRQFGKPSLSQHCGVPELGPTSNNLRILAQFREGNLQTFPLNYTGGPSVCSSFFGLEAHIGVSNVKQVLNPIDHIFQFHKALRKELKYLDIVSGRITNCDERFLRDFDERFRLLWGLYKAHSNAEDEIVFPALEAKEVLHNVSHSYTIDHKQEEELFEEISSVLFELSQLQEWWTRNSLLIDSDASTSPHENQMLKYEILSAKLQGKCKSLRIALDLHVSCEELELWPLFYTHFSAKEQDMIIGQVFGTTGAEVLQTMLPWVTAALTQDEQKMMLETLRNATHNTMFNEWLNEWWKDSPISSNQSQSALEDGTVPPSGTVESLQMLADYLSRIDHEVSDLNRENPGSLNCLAEIDSYTYDQNHSAIEHTFKDDDMNSSIDWSIQKNEPSAYTTASLNKDNKHVLEMNEVQHFQHNVELGIQKFKPGWKDIFRMSQEELASAIRKVSRDTSLDPRRKAYLMQNLMTSGWIVSQQQLPQTKENHLENGKDIPGQWPSYRDADKSFGCKHYKRNCKLLSACCGQLFTCKLCHDEVSNHLMDRKATKDMMCMKCLQIQPVAPSCVSLSCEGFSMAHYFCSICKLFDDKRNIYHCPFCNLCRVGKGLGIDYFHCMNCNGCMSKTLSVHKCREKSFESNCPICNDFIFTSSDPVKALRCGHFMHSYCFQEYTDRHYTCPICNKSLGDMAVYFEMLDALLDAETLPRAHQGRNQNILCNDCEMKGKAPYHWLYHKCSTCGSYNTRVS